MFERCPAVTVPGCFPSPRGGRCVRPPPRHLSSASPACHLSDTPVTCSGGTRRPSPATFTCWCESGIVLRNYGWNSLSDFRPRLVCYFVHNVLSRGVRHLTIPPQHLNCSDHPLSEILSDVRQICLFCLPDQLVFRIHGRCLFPVCGSRPSVAVGAGSLPGVPRTSCCAARASPGRRVLPSRLTAPPAVSPDVKPPWN